MVDIQTVYYAVGAIVGIITICGAIWGVLTWQKNHQNSPGISLVPRERLPPVEIPDWLENNFRSLALLMKSFPEYCIEDRGTYHELDRRIDLAVQSAAYQELLRKSGFEELQHPVSSSKGASFHVGDAMDALNYAHSVLRARTCFKKRWWE